MGVTVTRSEYAAIKGWSAGHVGRLVKAGRIPLTEDDRIDVEAADAALAATRDPRYDGVRAHWARVRARKETLAATAGATDANEGLSDTGTLAEAKARRETYLAELARLEVEKAHGRLVEAEAVERATYDRFRIIRDRLQALPARLAPELATDADAQHAAHALLEREIHAVLEGLVAALDDEAA